MDFAAFVSQFGLILDHSLWRKDLKFLSLLEPDFVVTGSESVVAAARDCSWFR